VTSSGRTVGVVSHRNGRRDLVPYDVDDPDASLASIPLTDEAKALADVLGAPLMLGQLAGLREQAADLMTEQVAISAVGRLRAIVRRTFSGPFDDLRPAAP
jgi:TrkA domain protein